MVKMLVIPASRATPPLGGALVAFEAVINDVRRLSPARKSL